MNESSVTACCPELVEKGPEETYRQFLEVEGYLDLGLPDMAKDALKELPVEWMSRRPYYHALAMISLFEKNWEDLDRCCLTLIDRLGCGAQYQYWLWQVKALEMLEKPEEALERLDECDAQHGRLFPSLCNRLQLLVRTGSKDEARALMRYLKEHHEEDLLWATEQSGFKLPDLA